MLSIRIPDSEVFDDRTMTFIPVKGMTLELEHSLVSVSKWEAKWKKPFLGREEKTPDETRDYIRCMTKTQNVNPYLYTLITNEQLLQIREYINDPMTATTIDRPEGKGASRKVITSEEIYFYLSSYQIPFTVEKWHLNRVMTLLRIAEEKNKPPKKMRKGEIAKRNRQLNAARRARMGTRG